MCTIIFLGNSHLSSHATLFMGTVLLKLMDRKGQEEHLTLQVDIVRRV